MKIVLISGKARSGKDTFYKIASEFISGNYKIKCFRFAFADEVKKIAKELGWNGEKDEKGRSGLIMIGDGARRYFDENIWIKKLIKNIRYGHLVENDSIIFITDCRYLNEIESLKLYYGLDDHKVYTVRINRNNYDNGLTPEQQKNESETELDNYDKWDFVIENDGDLKDFETKVIDVINKIIN